MSENPTDIVGHKSFDTGERDPATGLPILRHEPLTRAEADAIIAGWDADQKRRAETMPTERDAIIAMWEARQRLIELGWRDAVYCPKDGTPFQIIEAGSTGVFDAVYSGEWPHGYIVTHDDSDSYVSKPGGTILFKPIAPSPLDLPKEGWKPAAPTRKEPE